MSNFEKNYRANASKFLTAILWLHLPILVVFALTQNTSVGVAVIGSVLLCAAPTVLVAMNPSGLAAAIAIACATMGFSGLTIYLGAGKIEYHFHVFSFLAVVTALTNPWAQIAAAVTIALHHVIGWAIAPRAVFNYDAAFSDVMLHAFFVVVETGICLRIVSLLSDTVKARGILEEQVSQASDGVTTGSREIEAFVHTLAGTASTQAQMVDQVADASRSLESDWTSREKMASETEAQLRDAVERIAACRRDLELINRDMNSLAEANRKVNGIMTLVTDIARQTNILAVNASIEASRSGAAGAGFGIIADQVRDLARRTGEAAKDIESVLTGSISTVDRNAHALDDVTRSMGVVADATQQMSKLTTQLVEQGRAQGNELSRISTAIQKISAGTQHLASGAEESSSVSTELARQAKHLDGVLASIR
ncbi:MAG: methyl-accepting chemotaxis protein [Bryobacter sp.]|nr:methyl-accepting chemotaxis protein [Bryobacter sp.]